MEVLDVLAQDSCSPGGIGTLGYLRMPPATGSHRSPLASPHVFSLLRNYYILQKLKLSPQEITALLIGK